MMDTSKVFVKDEEHGAQERDLVAIHEEQKFDEGTSQINTSGNATEIVEPTEDTLFVEDRNPFMTEQNMCIPKYDLKLNLSESQTTKALSKRERKKLKNSCFNCSKTKHDWRHCELPMDYCLIKKNKKEFVKMKKASKAKKCYVSDPFTHLVPEEPSEELPMMFYPNKGGLLGYICNMPSPGWSTEAAGEHLDNTKPRKRKGKKATKPSKEHGEFLEQDVLDKFGDLIFHYPSFYLPSPPDAKADNKGWNSLPLIWKQERPIRKSMKSSNRASKSTSTESQDMFNESQVSPEVSDGFCKLVPCMPFKGSPRHPPKELPIPSTSTSSTSIAEPSLSELEEQRRFLLAELKDDAPPNDTSNDKQ